MIHLGTIKEEAADCRAAWAACPDATHGAHIHHAYACEKLTEPIENRIAYILAEKPQDEHALRLRLMRPTTATAYKAWQDATATADKAYHEATATAYKALHEATATAHRLVCHVDGCPFDGRTIFPEAP